MEVYWCHQNTLHLSCGEMGDSKEENQWKLEVVDLAVRLNELFHSHLSCARPSLEATASYGVHISGLYDVWQSCHGYRGCVQQIQWLWRGVRGGQARQREVMVGWRGRGDGRRRAQIEWQLVQVGDSLVTVMEGEKLHRTLSSCSYGHCYPLQHCRLSLLLKTQQRFQICAVKADNSVWTHCSRADCAHSATALNPGHSSG